MNHVSFIFCLHNHQPEGNFDEVFADATEKAYLPFLRLMERYPAVKVSMHNTGILLGWFERNRPEVLELLRALVKRGQLELLSGAYHEPILPIIPDRDKVGQIRKLTTYVERNLGYQPRGMWLAERIWEQGLVKPMAEADMEFTVLDDSHFLYAGLREEDLYGYYVTEEQGKPMVLFPINKDLRYLIPFGTIEKNLEYFGRLRDEQNNPLLVYADDGEKFGIWPDTFDHVWNSGWLERFFQMLDENKEWLKTTHFGDVLDIEYPQGRVYIPSASYAEMMHWALPSAEAYRDYQHIDTKMKRDPGMHRYRQFLRGGFWRNFLVKYPEVNTMHKKMLRISQRIADAELDDTSGKETVLDLQQAKDYLWAAQCNCAYWHGVFGGVYLPHIRSEVFRNLIKAEKLLDELDDNLKLRMSEEDFDLDGKDEIVVENRLIGAIFDPGDGGKLIELDFKPSTVNVSDVLTRKEEGYHEDVSRAFVKAQGEKTPESEKFSGKTAAKEAHLERYLIYDWYRKGSFIDHILGEDVTIEEFARAQFNELGDFANQPYLPAVRRYGEFAGVTLHRNGGRWLDGAKHSVGITKTFTFNAGSSEMDILYRLDNYEAEPVRLRFGIEMNYTLFSGTGFDRYYDIEGVKLGDEEKKPNSQGIVEGVNWFSLKDEWDNFVIYTECDKAAEMWRTPLESVSKSEDGFERTYQGSTVLLLWDVLLKDSWTLTLKHAISEHHSEQ